MFIANLNPGESCKRIKINLISAYTAKDIFGFNY